MHVLFAAAEESPPRYASVNEIFGRGLNAHGHTVTGIFYGDGSAGTWAGGRALSVPRPRRQPLTAVVGSVVAEWRALGRAIDHAGPARMTIVRDDPVMALAAMRKRVHSGPLVYQLSHLNVEEMLEHADRGIYGSATANRVKALGSRSLRFLALRGARLVIVMTEEARDALGLSTANTLVLGEGVSREWTPDMDPVALRSSLGIPNDAQVILYAGTLNLVRELRVLVEAFAAVRARRPDAWLVVAGEGREPSDRKVLEREVSRHGAGAGVLFLPPQPHRRIAALLDMSALAVSPIPNTAVLRCNSPVKMFEAMHRSRAVVASDIPEHTRVLETARAGLIVPHDAAAYAAAMLRLLDQPETTASMGAAGRRWVLANRTYEALADRLAARLASVGG